MLPPDAERAIGMRAYLTPTPGIGGRLRAEAEDFQVLERGPGPPPHEVGRLTAARVRLRNWETNRFVGRAARELGVRPGKVAFAGMKDKRAVTEQWFTFPCRLESIVALERLQDVEVLAAHRTHERAYSGSHAGNRFVLRVRGHNGDRDAVAAVAAALRETGGVPNLFGPQRFGAAFRPITHRVGRAIVEGDLEEAVRLFVGHPLPQEREEARRGREVYEATRDPAAALEAFPAGLEPERQVLQRLAQRPGQWRAALQALPENLLRLFVHAHQSYLFNRVLSARLEAGLGLATAHVGDRVMAREDDGTRTVLVTADNRARVQLELDARRAVLTAPLPGPGCPLAEGPLREVEQAVLDEEGVRPEDFRCRELPEVASEGRRRGVFQPVDLEVDWVEGDPVVSFDLGRGAYATVVMREFLKADVDAY